MNVDFQRGIDNLVRLRRVTRRADPHLRSELDAVTEGFIDLFGPTVRPADAARALGITEPSLKRWLDDREVATVVTPAGRREIPLQELLELLDEVDEARDSGSRRPLAAVIRARRRRAEESVHVDRLLPRSRGRTHRTAELQALAFHRLLAERLDDRLLAQTRRRLETWERTNRIDPRWSSEWHRILSLSLEEVRQAISADTPEATRLRQTSPFAGVLTAQERKRLTESVASKVADE